VSIHPLAQSNLLLWCSVPRPGCFQGPSALMQVQHTKVRFSQSRIAFLSLGTTRMSHLSFRVLHWISQGGGPGPLPSPTFHRCDPTDTTSLGKVPNKYPVP
jgi:hypothetical protein